MHPVDRLLPRTVSRPLRGLLPRHLPQSMSHGRRLPIICRHPEPWQATRGNHHLLPSRAHKLDETYAERFETNRGWFWVQPLQDGTAFAETHHPAEVGLPGQIGWSNGDGDSCSAVREMSVGDSTSQTPDSSPPAAPMQRSQSSPSLESCSERTGQQRRPLR